MWPKRTRSTSLLSQLSAMPTLFCLQHRAINMPPSIDKSSARCSCTGFVTALAFFVSACGEQSQKASDSVTLTEKPRQSVSLVQAVPTTSQFSVRFRVPHQDLLAVLEKNIPQSRKDEGRERVCKKVLGINACSTVKWNYELRRTGDVSLDSGGDSLILGFPFEFDGTAGIKGDLAKVLGLSAIDFDGAMDLQIDASIDVGSDWCPRIASDINYQWVRQPRVEWVAGLDFKVTKLLDKQLRKEFESMDERLAGVIDCEQIRADVARVWQTQSYPLEIDSAVSFVGESVISDVVDTVADSVSSTAESGDAASNLLHLNVVPLAAAFSGVLDDDDHLGVALRLDAQISLDSEPLASSARLADPQQNSTAVEGLVNPDSVLLGGDGGSGAIVTETVGTTLSGLPKLQRIPYEVAKTDFSLLIRLPYQLIAEQAAAEVVGRSFESDTVAGSASVIVNSLDIFPADNRLAIATTFTADLPASRGDVKGELYMTSLPVVDSNNQLLTLTDIKLTPAIDSVIWNTVANLFESRIISALRQQSSINLARHLDDLEDELLSQFADSGKTRGARVSADDLEIRLESMVPESSALALVLRATTALDVELPYTVFD